MESARVTDKTNPLSGDSTITFSAAFANALTGLTPYMKGQGVAATRMVSLSDITAATTLYTLSNTSNDWKGYLDSTTTSWTNTAGRTTISRIAQQRGEMPTHILVSYRGQQGIADGMVNNVRFTGGTMDPYGLKMEFDGLKVIPSANCSTHDLYFTNKKDVRLHRFRDFAPSKNGEKTPGMNRGAIEDSQTTFSGMTKIWGAFNLRVQQRNGWGRMSGLTFA